MPHARQDREHIVGGCEPPEMALSVPHPEFRVGEQRHRALRLLEGDEGIRVTAPPADRNLDVRQGDFQGLLSRITSFTMAWNCRFAPKT